MTQRWSVASLVLVLLTALSARADVAPFPSWRLAANGPIASAVQAGSTIYLGGSFTKIGRAITPLDGILDLATLNFTEATGCAHSAGSALSEGYWPSPLLLQDGAGPFPLPPGTSIIRVGVDCRFDRRFRPALPAGTSVDGLGPRLIDAGGRTYFSGTYSPSPTSNVNSVRVVVELDGETGALRRYWVVQTPYAVVLQGATPDGRLLATTRTDTGALVVGWFDITQGIFQPARTLPNAGFVTAVGSIVMASQTLSASTGYIALDGTTLAPLPQWPVVSALGSGIASGGGRLFFTGVNVTVNGVVAPRLIAFDAASGARDTNWTAPAWTDDAATRVSRLFVSGGRLIALGDFAAGAPRDTAAAFDATTGALDPWVFPFVATSADTLGSRIYFPALVARDRVLRRGLAAVDASTGAVLAWTAADTTGTESALVADVTGGHLYAGLWGGVRRWQLANGSIDPTWQLDVVSASGQPATPTALALHGSLLFATGMFDTARDGATGAWQPREGAVAITTGGTLAGWRPRLQATCVLLQRGFPFPMPCVTDLRISDDRVVVKGNLQSLDGRWTPPRSALAFTLDTAAVDPLLPPAPTGVVDAIAADASGLYAVARIGQAVLAHVTASSGARVLGPLVSPLASISKLAVRSGRLYADFEYDAVTGQRTENPFAWASPTAVDGGVLDVLVGGVLGWHSAVAAAVPAAPVNLAADLDGARATLRWTPGAGDLQPLMPPLPGGTAATAHLVLASLTPGGPTVAQLDTGSPDTTFSVVAPPGTYYLRVQARNGWGTSAPSAAVRIDVVPLVPEAPVATTASAMGSNALVQWQAPPHGWPATGYLLEAGTASGASNLGTLPVSGLEFRAALPPGRYYLRVRAVNASGPGPAGDERLVVVQ